MGEENTAGLLPVMGTAFILSIVGIIAVWKIFVKAGKPGWAAIIPIYNMYVLLKIVGRPGWWLLLFFIPIANIIIPFVVAVDLAKAFKRSTVFGIVLLGFFSFIGYLILGFGKSVYSNPSTVAPTPVPQPASQT